MCADNQIFRKWWPTKLGRTSNHSEITERTHVPNRIGGNAFDRFRPSFGRSSMLMLTLHVISASKTRTAHQHSVDQMVSVTLQQPFSEEAQVITHQAMSSTTHSCPVSILSKGQGSCILTSWVLSSCGSVAWTEINTENGGLEVELYLYISIVLDLRKPRVEVLLVNGFR